MKEKREREQKREREREKETDRQTDRQRKTTWTDCVCLVIKAMVMDYFFIFFIYFFLRDHSEPLWQVYCKLSKI